MSHKKTLNQVVSSTQLLLPSDFSQKEKVYYRNLYLELPRKRKNELNITGIELTTKGFHTIKAISFIRTTIGKPVSMKLTKIVLLDRNLDPFAEKEETFPNLGTLHSTTSQLFSIEFSVDHLK